MPVVKLKNKRQSVYNFDIRIMVKKSPEASLSPELEASEMGALPFQEQEAETVTSLTERYAETTKIDPKSIKNADGFLARDAESVYRDFALEWFKNNEEEMSKEGVIIPPGVSDEWKISMVLAS